MSALPDRIQDTIRRYTEDDPDDPYLYLDRVMLPVLVAALVDAFEQERMLPSGEVQR